MVHEPARFGAIKKIPSLYRMLPTDYVARACVVSDLLCTLACKCEECKKEMKSLSEVDEMFAKVITDLEAKLAE